MGAETVLLVEDDGQARLLVGEVLRRQGYAVLGAGGGGEALRLAEGHPGPIHLLLTDVVMPEMSGREVAERVRSRRLATRVLYVSGYLDATMAEHGLLRAEVAFLKKPLQPDVLTRKVREVLDADEWGAQVGSEKPSLA